MKRSLSILIASQVGAMSLWFSAAAITVSLAGERGLAPADLASLTTATQLGFVAGALLFAILGLPDRYDPRRVFAISAWVAAVANLALFVVPPEGAAAVASRALLGAALAGVYPVGMKIAVGWTVAHRGLLVSLLVAALTLGSALPHLIAFLGGTDWRAVILTTSLCAALSGCAMLFILLGPHHQSAGSFQPRAIVIAFSDPAIRRAYFGYFGHMWELYAFWAWVGTMAALAALDAGLAEPAAFGSLIAFCAIALGGLATVPAGAIADRIGKAPVAGTALLCSGLFGVAAAFTFGGPLWLFAGVLILWGIAVIPDSAQLSAMVADAAPPQYAGSIMTLQNAIGFALSAISVELTPVLAEWAGWPVALLVLVAGPAVGIAALARRAS